MPPLSARRPGVSVCGLTIWLAPYKGHTLAMVRRDRDGARVGFNVAVLAPASVRAVLARFHQTMTPGFARRLHEARTLAEVPREVAEVQRFLRAMSGEKP